MGQYFENFLFVKFAIKVQLFLVKFDKKSLSSELDIYFEIPCFVLCCLFSSFVSPYV